MEHPWPRASLIAVLSDTERQALLSAGTRITFARGDVLLRQGEPGGGMFALVGGYAKVTITGSGGEVILGLRGRGDLVGEFTVIDGRPRTATVTCVSSLATVRIGRTQFEAFCRHHPEANAKIMQSLTDKLRRASERQAATRNLDSHSRIAKILYDVATEHGAVQQDGAIMLPPLTQSDWAALAAVAPSTVERALKDFRTLGIVLNRYRRTVVLDVDGLAAAVSSESPNSPPSG